MADSILDGRWKVYYSAENRQKRLWRDTAVTPTVTDTVNDLYSATQNLFDELTQMDDGVPMSAQTPTEYTLGIIDAGDKDPWFMDRTSAEYLTGGAIKTASWTRNDTVQGGTDNVGIVRITCNNTDIVAGDIGFDISHTNGDTGTLLDVKGTGAGSILWVRPDSTAETNSFPDTSGTLTCNAHTATQSAAAVTGESLWANIFSIGTIESNTHIYVKQGSSLLQTYKATSPASDWWGDGHVDILVNVKEIDVESDEGVIQVFARQHSKTYDHFETDLTAGGRNPIPLSTGNDLDNQVGYWQTDMVTSSGTFVVGEVFDDDATGNKRAVVTSWDGGTKILEYYHIGDPINLFSNGDAITGVTSGATGTIVTPTAVNGAFDTDITINLGETSAFDINENDTTERYSIIIDCNNKTLEKMQQRVKYLTRRGETSDLDDSSAIIAGQFYIGSDRRIVYNTLTGTISQGQVVTQLTSLATGTVVAHHTAEKILILRNSRGTFNTTNNIEVDGSNFVTMTGGTATVISPTKASPFGTFAGGTFFGAPGVVLDNVASADASNYQLTDDQGNVVNPPTKVSVVVSNTETNDKIAVFRLDAGEIDKDRYTVNAAGNPGDTTITVTPAITVDEPGKTTGGVLRLVDVSGQIEYRIRYASWSGSIFTLANETGTMDDTGGTTTSTNLHDDGKSFLTTVKVGDLVLNTTRSNAVSYVTAVVDNTNLTISPAITGQASGDAYEINAVPIILASGTDTLYVPILDVFETATGQEDTTITYSANVSVRIRARNAGDIIPFEQDSTITDTGMTVSVIRTPDSIFQP